MAHGAQASQQTQNICITFIQRRPNVIDVGPSLYNCHTHVLCLLVGHAYAPWALPYWMWAVWDREGIRGIRSP